MKKNFLLIELWSQADISKEWKNLKKIRIWFWVWISWCASCGCRTKPFFLVANSSVLFRNILFRVKKLRVFNLKNYLIWRTWIISQLLFGISYPISNPSLLNKSYRFWQFRNISLICFVCDTFCSFSELPKSARFMRIRLKSLLGPHRTGQNTDVSRKKPKKD